ncbi:hypothetical protein ANN_02560 [Periplaneta americana]|uniref:Uncharacterized protein n=1 Tax=Periplaneta americana TaxID=6978 RepID=A0ABQ8TWQ4_PERAM|nr:hypothetical protein ANN_02560 [Periplaneta americana]
MAGLCEGGNEPLGSLKAINKAMKFSDKSCKDYGVQLATKRGTTILGVQFKVCHGSLYAVMWLADEPREFNLPTLPQRCITYEVEELPSNSEEEVPIRTVTPVVAGM